MTDVRSVRIGPFTLDVVTVTGAIVYVVVNGHAPADTHRGVVRMTGDEWNRIVRTRDQLAAASVVAEHWRDQDGINAAYIDALAESFR